MADNTTINAGSGGDTVRDKDRAGVKTQVVGIDVGIGTGTEALMSSSNPMPVSLPTPPATGTITSPASVSTSDALVLASNAARKGATVWCESGATCYVALAAAASLTSYAVQVAVGAYYEVPFGYTGAVRGITSSGTAVLRVTEIT